MPAAKVQIFSSRPYDILRLKDNLGMSVTDFLKNHTVPFEMDKDGIPRYQTAYR